MNLISTTSLIFPDEVFVENFSVISFIATCRRLLSESNYICFSYDLSGRFFHLSLKVSFEELFVSVHLFRLFPRRIVPSFLRAFERQCRSAIASFLLNIPSVPESSYSLFVLPESGIASTPATAL